ncbi:MAG TPA: vancomycin resistance histidine kinase VanS, partial [Firmicutes bacterium]|nr:vancomycin resistance histidine kinase VanS [Bacillota bacterium]
MKSDFSRLKRKIIFSIILISVLAFIVAISFKVLLIDGVLQE